MKVCEMSSHQAFLFVPVLLTNLSFSRLSCLNVFEYLQTFGFVPVSVDFLMIDAENPQSIIHVKQGVVCILVFLQAQISQKNWRRTTHGNPLFFFFF